MKSIGKISVAPIDMNYLNVSTRFFALLLLLIAVPCSARTINVSNYKELRDACNAAQPHDTIVLATGVYTIIGGSRIMIQNRPGPIVVKGATGNSADIIIEGQGQDNEAAQTIFNLNNSPQWTFQDLSTRNSYYHGFKFDGDSTDCTLRNIVMRDHGESGVKGTSNPTLGKYPDRLLVEKCDIGFTTIKGGMRSVVEGVDGVGVNDWKIRNSRFVNIQKNGDVAYAVFTKGNSSNTIIENNRFENCFIGASFGGGGTGEAFFRDNNREYEHRGGSIRNNMFIRCTDAAIYINKGRDCKIDNNTLFECGLTIQLRYTQSSGFVRNNLVKPLPNNPNEPIIRLRDGATLLSQLTNKIATAADFKCATGPDEVLDLHLQDGSSAIDGGTNLGADVATDFDGQMRPQGKAFDIGADEWSSAKSNN